MAHDDQKIRSTTRRENLVGGHLVYVYLSLVLMEYGEDRVVGGIVAVRVVDHVNRLPPILISWFLQLSSNAEREGHMLNL